MSYLKEKVSYLKGLSEGMQISDSTNEGKLLKAIIEALDDIALAVEDVQENQEQMNEQLDSIDEDLAEMERVLFDEEDEEDDDEDICFGEFECPYCEELIEVDEDMINEDDSTIECPSCHKKIELDWECDCEECKGEEHN
ncbi:MAG TPA: hypothetical protein VHT34_10135 [Clostridia bacterium]|nr:hypothetical protein [Clostridia bacterium]